MCMCTYITYVLLSYNTLPLHHRADAVVEARNPPVGFGDLSLYI